LRKMANRAKKDQVIFSNLAELLVEWEVEIDDDDWPKTNDILIILALSLTSLNLIAIIWLVYKVRVLGGAILLVKNLSTAYAFILYFFLWNNFTIDIRLVFVTGQRPNDVFIC
jgi:hypothetical protein